MTKWPALMLATLLMLGLAYLAGHQRGAKLQRQAHAAQQVASLSAAVDRLRLTSQRMAHIGTQIRDALSTSHEQERIVTRTVTEVIREHPEFAAQHRPAQLDQLRREQLQAIARATSTDMPR